MTPDLTGPELQELLNQPEMTREELDELGAEGHDDAPLEMIFTIWPDLSGEQLQAGTFYLGVA